MGKVATRKGTAVKNRRPAHTPKEWKANGVLELSSQEVYDLVDKGAKKMLDMSGEEFLRLRREKKTEKGGAWTHLSMLASLLDTP